MVGPEIALPMHWDRKAQADYPERYMEHLRTEAPHVRVAVLQPGETLEV